MGKDIDYMKVLCNYLNLNKQQVYEYIIKQIKVDKDTNKP